MATIYTHTPGFTFGIARPLLVQGLMSPGSTCWRDGQPARGKGGAGGVAQPIAAWRNYRVELLSLVCGYVSAVFIEVATELGRIGRLISDRITAEVSQMSRSDFGNRGWVPAWQAKRRDGICRASPPWRVYLNYPSVCASSIASGGFSGTLTARDICLFCSTHSS